MFDIQKSPQPGEWFDATHDGADIPPGDYAIQAKQGNVDYAIGAAAPLATQSVVTLVPLQLVPITIGDGEKLRLRMFGDSAELHVCT